MDTLRGSRCTLDVDDMVVACENRRIVLRVAVWFAWNHQMLYGPVRREILIIRERGSCGLNVSMSTTRAGSWIRAVFLGDTEGAAAQVYTSRAQR